MNENGRVGVFISGYGEHANEISNEIKKVLGGYFGDKVVPYICARDKTGKVGVAPVINKLKKSKIFIFVLTESRAHAACVLYEFAYASALCDLNGDSYKIYPIKFGNDWELPSTDAFFDKAELFDEDTWRKIMTSLQNEVGDGDDNVSAENELAYLHTLYGKSSKAVYNIKPFADIFQDIIRAHEKGKQVEQAAKANLRSKAGINNVINPDLVLLQKVKRQATGKQASLGAPDVAQGKTLGEIPDMFASYLEKLQDRDKVLKPVAITEDLLAAMPHQNVKYQHNLWFKGTRISTFLAIRDESRILIWDRCEADNLQSVKNNRFDCFGAVAFENYTIFMKISGEAFKNAVVQSLSKIPSIAFEDIETEDFTGTKGSYLCMMFGYEAVISATDFDAIVAENQGKKSLVSEEIGSFELYNYVGLTSKAQAYYDYLFLRGVQLPMAPENNRSDPLG